MNILESLKNTKDAPLWMTDEAYDTLRKGYLLENETPKQLYTRVAKASANHIKMPEKAEVFFKYMWNNWLCLASPVAANMGTSRALPISCFGVCSEDSTSEIFKSYHETAMLTKHGGGIGKYWGKVRARGIPIKGGGSSEGIIPWLKVEEATLQAVSQAGVRRGAGAQYLDIDHGDIEEFIDIRRQTGDLSRRCLSNSFHHAVCISDDFMKRVETREPKAWGLWTKLLTTRVETGEPYIFFKDTANNKAPEWYKKNNLKIESSQLCSEILLHSDKDHTYVCCLSSLNLARYDEWKDSELIFDSTLFLDGVMQEFIEKAEKIEGFEKAVRFSKKGRALGLGALGWHTLLQSKMIPFESFQAMSLNAEIFKTLDEESMRATKFLAEKLGEPEWCKGFGVRNTHRLAIAPTFSNSILSGGVSQGIEPIVSNVFAQKSAKGTYIRKNKVLEALLESKNLNTFAIWNEINGNLGSVDHLKQLSKEEKEVFKTAREINQFSLIQQASQRQQFIDQGQSLNLFFAVPPEIDDEKRKMLAKYVHEVHFEAWKSGVITLYYLRTQSVLKGDSVFREKSDCVSCEG